MAPPRRMRGPVRIAKPMSVARASHDLIRTRAGGPRPVRSARAKARETPSDVLRQIRGADQLLKLAENVRVVRRQVPDDGGVVQEALEVPHIDHEDALGPRPTAQRSRSSDQRRPPGPSFGWASAPCVQNAHRPTCQCAGGGHRPTPEYGRCSGAVGCRCVGSRASPPRVGRVSCGVGCRGVRSRVQRGFRPRSLWARRGLCRLGGWATCRCVRDDHRPNRECA